MQCDEAGNPMQLERPSDAISSPYLAHVELDTITARLGLALGEIRREIFLDLAHVPDEGGNQRAISCHPVSSVFFDLARSGSIWLDLARSGPHA